QNPPFHNGFHQPPPPPPPGMMNINSHPLAHVGSPQGQFGIHSHPFGSGAYSPMAHAPGIGNEIFLGRDILAPGPQATALPPGSGPGPGPGPGAGPGPGPGIHHHVMNEMGTNYNNVGVIPGKSLNSIDSNPVVSSNLSSPLPPSQSL